jgi:D-3-phosphoglycerate dehydrogenase
VLAGGAPSSLTVAVRGDIGAVDARVLELSALKGLFAAAVEEPVSYVNAPLLAAERGMSVQLESSGESADYRNEITLQGLLPDGRTTSVSGTLAGTRHVQKIVAMDGFDVEFVPSGHLAFLHYADRPGVVGAVGRVLGEAGVNIAGMQVSRSAKGGPALMVLTVDTAIPGEVLQQIVTEIGASDGRTVELPIG